MIDSFRENVSLLTPDEKKFEQPINSLRKPCQIHVLSSPNRLFHLIIISHFEQLEDKSIKFLQLDPEKYVEQLEQFLDSDLWRFKEETLAGFEVKLGSYYSDRLIPVFVEFAQDIMKDRKNQLGGQELINEKFAVWKINGKLESFDFVGQSKAHILEYKRYAEEAKKTPNIIVSPNKELMIPGLSTYCYPPILVGEFNPPFRDRVFGRERELLKMPVLVEDFQGDKLIVSKGGLIGITSTNKGHAEEVFNAFMGCALCIGLSLHSVKTHEMAETGFYKDTYVAQGFTWSESSLRMSQFSWVRSPVSVTRLQISEDDLRLIVSALRELWANKRLLDNVRLLLGSYTLFSNQDFSQSFITSWSIIERYLYSLWAAKLEGPNITNGIRESLNKWDVSRIIEILHLDNFLDEDDYVEMKYLQGVRNKTIHEGYRVPQKLSNRCLDLSFEIIRKQMNITSTLSPNRILTV